MLLSACYDGSVCCEVVGVMDEMEYGRNRWQLLNAVVADLLIDRCTDDMFRRV